MNNRHTEVAMIVGDKISDELVEINKQFRNLERGRFANAIVVKDARVEVLALPEKHLAAFECEYCRNTFVVDLFNQAANCPGCGHGAPYEAIMLALNPIHQIEEIKGNFDPANGGVAYSPISGSYMHPDAIRYGQTTGSHPHPDNVRYAFPSAYGIGFYEPPLIPEPYPRVGAWYGELITNENRERIHKEMGEHYKKYGLF